MEHTVKTYAGVWYTINCTAPVTVTEIIDGATSELLKLDRAGSSDFRPSGSQVQVETNGKFRVLPFR